MYDQENFQVTRKISCFEKSPKFLKFLTSGRMSDVKFSDGIFHLRLFSLRLIVLAGKYRNTAIFKRFPNNFFRAKTSDLQSPPKNYSSDLASKRLFFYDWFRYFFNVWLISYRFTQEFEDKKRFSLTMMLYQKMCNFQISI